MPLPTNNSRPAIPYKPAQVLPNHNRYSSLGKSPPTAQQLDGDLNALVDLMNTLSGAVNDTAAGIFPGADNELNANKLPTTDGRGNVSWTHVTPLHVTDNAIHTRHILDAAITPDKIQAQGVGTNHLAKGAVTTPKLLDNAITTPKITDNAITTAKVVDGCVTEPKLADGTVTAIKVSTDAITTEKLINSAVTTEKVADSAVTTPKVADNAITTAKIIDKAVTIEKIGPGAALADTFLTADGKGNARFIDHIGRILQIVSYEYKDALYDTTACSLENPVSFSKPFQLKVTPKKIGSKIILYYSVHLSGSTQAYYAVVLCRNNTIWKVGSSGGKGGVTHAGYVGHNSNSHYGSFCFSNIFVDRGTANQPITYELKRAAGYATINRSPDDAHHSISTMCAVEVDI